MGRDRRVEHEAAGVADVGDVAVQLQAVDEAIADFVATDDLERQHRPVPLFAAVPLRPVVPRARREPCQPQRLELSGICSRKRRTAHRGTEALAEVGGIARRSDGLDGDTVGVSGQRLEVGTVAGDDGPARFGERDE